MMHEKVKLAAEIFIKRDKCITAYKGYSLLIDGVDSNESEEFEKKDIFNPNKTYLYNINSESLEKISSKSLKENISKFFEKKSSESTEKNNSESTEDENEELTEEDLLLYFLELIPGETNSEIDIIQAVINLLKFINWAVYYYDKLKQKYNSIKRYKTQEEISDSYKTVNIMADMLHDIDGIEFSEEDILKIASKKGSKKNFELKPTTFITLCELFARGWYDKHFFASRHKKGTIEFAHYVSCYIKHKLSKYNAKNSNIDSNLKKLFSNTKKLDFRFNYFHIIAVQIEYKSKREKYSYAIFISQYGCKHTFYLFAHLHGERYWKAKLQKDINGT